MLPVDSTRSFGAGRNRGGVRRATLFFLCAATLLAACNTRGYAFRVDESIDFTGPKARATVNLPVTITWADEKAPATLRADFRDPTAEYYGVFVDRAPIGPGKRLTSLVPDDDSCRRTPGCPGEAYFRDRDVFLTASPALTLELLDDLRPTNRGTSKDPHEVTVVRMRGERRVGEAAFRLNFFVRR